MRLLRSALLLFAATLAGCATMGKPLPPPPTTAEIVQLASEGTPAGEIIKRIDESRAVYRLPASELARLREQGVPDAVIDRMQRTHIDAVREEEWWRAREHYLWFGWPSYRGVWPYPYGTWQPYPYWGRRP